MKTFEIENLYAPPFDTEFKPRSEIPDGEGLPLSLNLGLVTLDFLDYMKRSIGEINEILEKPEENAEENAEALPETVEQPQKAGQKETQWVDDIREQMEFHAQILGGKPGETDATKRVIRAWGLVRRGTPVEVSYEELIGWNMGMLSKLFHFCVFQAGEPKKTSESPSASI